MIGSHLKGEGRCKKCGEPAVPYKPGKFQELCWKCYDKSNREWFRQLDAAEKTIAGILRWAEDIRRDKDRD